jgi:hypothetical protein
MTNAERRRTKRRALTSRVLTEHDVPFIRKTMESWNNTFHFNRNKAQLVTWLQKYPDATVEHAIEITHGWFKRTTEKGETITPTAAYCYASAVMRNVAEAQKTADKLNIPDEPAETEEEKTARAAEMVEEALYKLADSLPVLCSFIRPTANALWVIELNPVDGILKNLMWKTEDARTV